jgi:hypothetical protein
MPKCFSPASPSEALLAAAARPRLVPGRITTMYQLHALAIAVDTAPVGWHDPRFAALARNSVGVPAATPSSRLPPDSQHPLDKPIGVDRIPTDLARPGSVTGRSVDRLYLEGYN